MLSEVWRELFFLDKIVFTAGIVVLTAILLFGVVGYVVFGWTALLLIFILLFLSAAQALYLMIIHPALKRVRRRRALMRRVMGLSSHKIG